MTQTHRQGDSPTTAVPETGPAPEIGTGPGARAEPDLDVVATVADRVAEAICTVIEGKRQQVDQLLTVLLAGGHLLLEDVPGVGKTMLAKALARAIDASVRRIQFTPDLLPSDITGVNVFNQDLHQFEFRPGAVFANIVLGDEINRASPKTQSALLESMEEDQVTVDARTYDLPRPFMVIATQNPIDMEGTYPLPEAQRDRFMARISMGYPAPASEVDMLAAHISASPVERITPVTDAATVARAIAAVREVWTSPAIRQYVVDLGGATRSSTSVRLGASPRATLQLMRASCAQAALAGRDYVIPDDVQALAVPVLAHRILLSAEAQLARRTAADVITELVRRTPVPTGQR